MRWEDKKEVKKGNLGERVVDEYIIREKKMIPYQPVYDGPHPVDRIVVSPDKKMICIWEVKTKPRRKFYPDTGFNYRNYLEYKFLYEKYGLDTFIVFVDEWLMKAYGNYLTALEIEVEIIEKRRTIKYPLIERDKRGIDIIYFPISNTIELFDLTPGICSNLRALSSYSQDYSEVFVSDFDQAIRNFIASNTPTNSKKQNKLINQLDLWKTQ